MSNQIIFFKKNALDYSFPSVVVSASQGSQYAPFVQRRSNVIGWATTGSVDADNTTFTVDFIDLKRLTDIILVNHNFDSFTIQYWDGSFYQDFSPAINVSGSTDTTTHLEFAAQETTKIKITITGTQVPDSDKRMTQLIATEQIGQLNGWPVIKSPTFDLNRIVNKMLSGKTSVGVNVGGFNCDLTVAIWKDSHDLDILEALFTSGDGFLVWLCGGSESQFASLRQGYLLQDFFLMVPQNNYVPEFDEGVYTNGFANLTISLVESNE